MIRPLRLFLISAPFPYKIATVRSLGCARSLSLRLSRSEKIEGIDDPSIPIKSRNTVDSERSVVRRKQNRRQEKAKGSAADYRRLDHRLAPQEILSAEQVEQIHANALEILHRLGIEILLPEARAILLRAGARSGKGSAERMVFLPPETVQEAISQAPARYRMMAPNPARAQPIHSGRQLFAPAGGCPNAVDRIRGRRPGDLAGLHEALRLHQSFDVIHKLTPTPEPQDIPTPFRHYAMLRAQLQESDKPLSVYARGQAQVMQSFEMVRLALDLSDAEFAADPWVSTVINTNSPRLLDIPMAQGIIDFAREGQLAIITPFCLAGAMAPITLAGALSLQHAEALAGITLSQMTRAGAPVMYGAFGSNVDMRSGSPTFGTPTHVQMSIASGQLARHIGLPWRSAAGSTANTGDMQAGTENMMGLWASMLGHATLTLHAAGWLEGGLTFGYEKFINDIESLQMLAHLGRKIESDPDAMGFDAIAEVSPGGHFFSTEQTMARYDSEFYQAVVADSSNHGTWLAAGAQGSFERATVIWQGILAEFNPPPGAAERSARIEAYIEDHKAAGGAPIVD
ncbi:MAG: trimethylamine methyltransferase family protein [Ectothiorhodospiraceae bacterium AqS1]|nr:trimethylamine methyltransferase family protein [Ectothiorhodospiraceae bacterium AqS1]